MPGISLISSKANLLQKKEIIQKTINSLNLLDNYINVIHSFKENLFLGWNKYENYPVNIFHIDAFDILIEGKIYNKKRIF